MGGGHSIPIPGGGTHGYHVIRVQDNSPASLSKLEAYFDFIVTIQGLRLDEESDTLIDILKAHMDKEVKLGVYNIKTRSWREVGLTPSSKWGGQGVIGVSIRFCSFENVSENIWHILEVYPNSPAESAGFISNTDYIIGYEMMDEEFDTFIEQSNQKEVKLFVYNVESDKCRNVAIVPDQNWGGEGSLGCGVGTGYLHRIPNAARSKRQEAKLPQRKSDVEFGDEREMVRDFAEISLTNPTQQKPEEVTNIPPLQPKITTEQIVPYDIPPQREATKDVLPSAVQNEALVSIPLQPPVPVTLPAFPLTKQTSPISTLPGTEKKSPIPTAAQKNLFATPQFPPATFISPSSGLPTAPPTEFDLEISDTAFSHTQQPLYNMEPALKPLVPSHPSYTAVSPPTID